MKNIVIIAGIVITSIGFYCLLSQFYEFKPIELINSTLIFSTALVIAWYTVETNLLRAATVHNTETSISPKFAMEYIGENTIKITNIGNGTALNIRFGELLFEPNKSLSGKIAPIQYLEARSEREVKIQFNVGSGTLPFGANLDPEYLQAEQSIDIYFEDILHKHKTQKCVFGKQGTTISIPS